MRRGRLKTVLGRCYFAKGFEDKAREVLLEAESAILGKNDTYPDGTLGRPSSGNKIYLPPTYELLAQISLAQKDTLSALDYYRKMYDSTCDYDPSQVYEAAKGMAALLPAGSDERSRFAAVADSLDFVPALQEFENKVVAGRNRVSHQGAGTSEAEAANNLYFLGQCPCLHPRTAGHSHGRSKWGGQEGTG